MTNTIDKKIVQMGFENEEFEKGVDKTLKDVDKLKKGLTFDESARSFANLSNSMNATPFSGLTTAVQGISSKFSILGAIGFTAIQNITNSVIGLTKKLFDMASPINNAKAGLKEYETQINAVQTIMANTSAKGTTLLQVNEALDQLNTYADKTIYNFSEMTRNIGTFTAAGIDLDTSVSAIKGIANLAAVSGSNSQQASTAMYQLSQALSSGTLKLMDWNSVVNAGMGGQVFQDALKETARAHGVAVDDIIKKEGSFRESLTTGWITSSILTETLSKFTGDLNAEQLKTMGYTEDQIAAIIKMGQVANDAATKVKTFSQLKETLAEAIGSGWAQSWRIVVGDFEEAKALFTTISDVLGGLIGESADSRNAILQTWKDVGGRAAIVKGIQFAFEALVAVLKPIKEAFAAVFPPATGAQLLYLSLLVTDFARKLKLSSTGALKVKIIFRGLFSVFDIIRMAIVAVIKAFSKFTGVLGPASGGLIDLLIAFSSYIIRIREGIKLNDTFTKAIEKVIDIFKIAIGAVINFVSIFKGQFELLRPAIDKIKEFLSKFFSIDFVKELTEFKNKISGIFTGVDTSGVETFFDKFRNRFKPLSGLIDIVQKTFGKMVGVIQKLAPTFEKVQDKMLNGLTNFIKAIGEGIANVDFSTLFDSINAGLFTAILIGIKQFISKGSGAVDGVSGIFESIKGVFGGVTGILNGVRGSLEVWQQNLKAKTLMSIAGAIAILAISLIAISMIDSEKLTIALLTVTALFGDLMISMGAYSKVVGPGGGVGPVASLVAISIAILILAGAMSKLAKLDTEDINNGLLTISVLSVSLVAFGKTIQNNSGSMIKTAAGLIVFALGLQLIVGVVKRIGELDPITLTNGLIGVGVMMAELALFMKVADFDKGGIKSGIGILALVGAILILSVAVEKLGKMDVGELQNGMLAIGAILTEIAVFTRVVGDGKNIIATAIGVTILSAAMLIFSEVLTVLGKLSWEEISRGLTAMGLGLLIVVAAMEALPKDMIIKAVGLTVVAGALSILATVISTLGNMTWSQVQTGLLTLGSAMLILAIGMQAMQASISGALALIIVAGALTILTPVLKALGNMSLLQIGTALLALAGVFLVLGIAGAVLTPVVPTLLALAVAMGLIGVSLALIGGGLLMFATGMAMLAVSGAAGGLALVTIAQLLLSIVPMIVTTITNAILQFLTFIVDNGPKLQEAFTTMLLVIIKAIGNVIPTLLETLQGLLTALITLITDNIPDFITALLTLVSELLTTLAEKIPEFVQSGMDILLGFLKGIRDNIFEIVTVAIDIVTEFIDAVASKLPDIIDSGFNLIVKFIEGLATAIDENGDELRTAIGKLASAIIDGLADGLKSGVGAVAKAIGSLASSAISALKLLLGIHSPSTVFTEFGELTALGFVDGLVKMAGDVKEAATNIGIAAMNGMTESIKTINDFLLDSPEFTPVITPVVDLTNVVASKDSIGSIFNKAIAVSGVPRTLSSISSGTTSALPQDNVKNGEGNSVVTFTQNNYSPVPLSRFEIYRQTRNQLALVKQAIK
jgi:tape measure domain-containing protein